MVREPKPPSVPAASVRMALRERFCSTSSAAFRRYASAWGRTSASAVPVRRKLSGSP